MKRISILALACLPLYAFGQHSPEPHTPEPHVAEPHVVEPHVIDVVGEIHGGKENGNASGNKGGRDVSAPAPTKPGQLTVSDEAKALAKSIVDDATNAGYASAEQRQAIKDQLQDAARKASTEGRGADAKFLNGERERIDKTSAVIVVPPVSQPQTKPKRERTKPDVGGTAGGRN
ncbi:hypothetical protein KB206_10875 [Microvirga sp. STS02]|uniref:hypothetical protein n=1 Tax=Hymenobacter negativus TaxID=2795026 RepID=UPI0018DE2F89|nr:MULTISPECIES: hypothetical protein [Bacteria]MBH8569389.1 hypothetical protein [Hymenobacter negativus]MBR7209124.1 hypothetical protein [Microvirga sp. STS02]